MNLPFNIAKRYLFSKKSTNAINVISGISVFGLSVGTAVMILLLSVFNGLEDLLTSFFNTYNPDVKVLPVKGKTFTPDTLQIAALEKVDGVLRISKTLEEVAIFEYDKQIFGIIKGVDENFNKVNTIDTIIREGIYSFDNQGRNMAVVGGGVARKLGVNIDDFLTPITIYMAKRKKVSPTQKPFKKVSVYPSGVFVAHQEELDNNYIFTSLKFAEKLLGQKNRVSSLEIKLKPEANIKNTIAAMKSIMGDQYKFLDRYEQDETYFSVLKMEKWLAYALLSFAIILVAFNMVGALWVVVLDKKHDIAILKSMGAEAHQIRNIFLINGLLLSGLGLVIGIVLALTLYYIHQTWGIVTMPPGSIIEIYPAAIRFPDFIITAITVLVIGFLAAWSPAKKAAGIPALIQEE